MQQILKYVNEGFARDQNVNKEWLSLMENPKVQVGLLLNERIINVPVLLAPHLHSIFFEEVADVAQSIPNASPYLCDYFLLLSKSYNNLPKNNNKKNKSVEGEQFFREEERIYRKYAEFQVSFPIEQHDLSSRWTFQSDITLTKLFIVVKAENIPKIIEEIKNYIK